MVTLLGFVGQPTKSLFTPSQKIEHSGFDLDSISMTISLTHIKNKSLVKLLNAF